MKSLVQKIFSAALAAALLLPPLAPARASEALGHDLAARGTVLNTGAELSDGAFWSDSYTDLRREHYVVYAPNERVTPIVVCGETTRALTSVPDAARELEARGLRVVAGINGDYYGVSHGVPLGSTMTEGALRNANGDAYRAIGFRADGTALIGDPGLRLNALVNGGDGFPVFAFNHIRQSEYGIFLYDHRFNDRGTTGTSEPGVDVLCSVAGGALTIGGALTLRVEEVLDDATDSTVPEDMFVLTANKKAAEEYTARLLALAPGDELTVCVTAADTRWNDVVNLIGAPELLLENGAVCEGLPTGSAPRTAIGQREDGTLVFYTIDGRQSGYSIGATLTAVAMRLAELGCVTAVALDGGGSTTLVATMPDETEARVVNTPSGVQPRAVSNQIFLVASAEPSGVPDHIYLAPAAQRALPGARLPLAAAVVDTNYIPIPDADVALSADAGTVEDGELILPDVPGAVTAAASWDGMHAFAFIEAAAPEFITVTSNGRAAEALTFAQGERAALDATAWLDHLPLAGGRECFTWTADGDAGTLADDGTFTAAGDAACGALTVSAGGLSVTVQLTVAAKPFVLLEDFETPFAPRSDAAEEGETPRLTLTRETDAAYVRLGRASGRLAYALAEELSAVLPLACAVPAGCDRLELWALGGGGASLAFVTDAGETEPLPLAPDWTYLCFPLPAGARAVTGLILRVDAEASGTLWLDQLVLAHGAADAAAPVVTLAFDAETRTLAGRAFDAVNGAALPTLRLTLDGAALDITPDGRTGELTAVLPEDDGLAHHAALTAGDAAGNMARADLVLPAAADAAPAFPDMAGHWAAGAVEFLKRTGVSNGSGGLYKPDAHITRQEFATMLYRYLKPEAAPDDGDLPFADRERIAPWALDAVRTMYAIGVVGGSKGSDGSLRCNPGADITRREAATMLGRLLEKGYAAPAPAYLDVAEIPSWAAEHVAVLSALGVFDDFAGELFLPAQPLTRAEMASMLLRLR